MKKLKKGKGESTHKWIKYPDSKDIDIFAAEDLGSDYHNGPKCERCGFEFCHHCFPDGYKTSCGSKSLGSNDNKLDPGLVALSESLRMRI